MLKRVRMPRCRVVVDTVDGRRHDVRRGDGEMAKMAKMVDNDASL